MSTVWHTNPGLDMPHILADKLNGEFDLRFEDIHHGDSGKQWVTTAHEMKTVALANLLSLYDAVQRCGWNTHTGDWDWLVEITLADGTKYENTNVGWDFCRADRVPIPQNELTACVQGAPHDDEPPTIQWVQFYATPMVNGEPDYEAEEEERFIPIMDIVSIRFEELH